MAFRPTGALAFPREKLLSRAACQVELATCLDGDSFWENHCNHWSSSDSGPWPEGRCASVFQGCGVGRLARVAGRAEGAWEVGKAAGDNEAQCVEFSGRTASSSFFGRPWLCAVHLLPPGAFDLRIFARVQKAIPSSSSSTRVKPFSNLAKVTAKNQVLSLVSGDAWLKISKVALQLSQTTLCWGQPDGGCSLVETFSFPLCGGLDWWFSGGGGVSTSQGFKSKSTPRSKPLRIV